MMSRHCLMILLNRRAASRPSRPTSAKAARKHAETLLASLVNKSMPSVPHPSRPIPAGPCKQAPASLASRPAPAAARQKLTRKRNGEGTWI
jgi:hypothetical protein